MRLLLLTLLLIGFAATARAADCPYNANAAGLREGQSLACTCAGGAGGARIYGTDRYTSDSGLCSAAIHAGVIGADGGEITLVMGGTCQQFVASERNGVISAAYGAYGPTFGFTDPLPPCPEESAAAGTSDRLTRECLARGRSAEACQCEVDVLGRELGLDVAALLQRINDAVAAGGKSAKVAAAVEQQLTDAGLGLSSLPELRELAETARAALAKECPP